MSDSDRPELRAFRELETLVRNLGEELATFRRHALAAEAQLKETGRPVTGAAPGGDRLSALEQENAQLRARLERVEDRTRQMMDRVRFLRQQLQAQAAPPVGAGRT